MNHKYEIEDFLTGKQVTIPKEEQFFHERPEWAIVTPEMFGRAQEITRFLDLETITNMDMRRIVDHILVSRDGTVKVVLKQFEDIT